MSIIDRVQALIALARSAAGAFVNLMKGEPLRVITYGAVTVVWIVTHVAVDIFGYTGFGTFAPTFDTILLAVTAAAAAITEFARRFVVPEVKVQALVDQAVADALAGPPDS